MASIALLNLSLSGTPKTLIPNMRLRPHFPSPQTMKPKTPKMTAIRMSHTTVPVTDRLISAVSYALPFFESFKYGRSLLAHYLNLRPLFDPILPFLILFKSLPYLSFVAFFGLYLGVVRNPSLSRYVRFNAMQAVTLDVLLVLPMLFQRIFSPERTSVGFLIMVWAHNALFVFCVVFFVYGLASSALGRTPYLPFVADAAGSQI